MYIRKEIATQFDVETEVPRSSVTKTDFKLKLGALRICFPILRGRIISLLTPCYLKYLHQDELPSDSCATGVQDSSRAIECWIHPRKPSGDSNTDVSTTDMLKFGDEESIVDSASGALFRASTPPHGDLIQERRKICRHVCFRVISV